MCVFILRFKKILVVATRGGRIELTTEQLKQPVEQPPTPAVHTARGAQLSHGLFVADTRVADPGAVAVTHADHI